MQLSSEAGTVAGQPQRSVVSWLKSTVSWALLDIG